MSAPRGEGHRDAKLTEEDVLLLRACAQEAQRLRKQLAELSLAALARKFGVSRESVSRAIQGETWQHVRFPENG